MFFRKLHALRGIAAVFVALFHFTGPSAIYFPVVSQADIFVDFFFILSGFVLLKSYGDRIFQRQISFGKYIFLRFMRLYPLHLAIMIVWAAMVGGKILALHQGIGHLDASFYDWPTFFKTVFLLNSFGLTDRLAWNYPTWSISAEFFTYMFFFGFLFLLSFVAVGCKARMFSAAAISLGAYAALIIAAGYDLEAGNGILRHFDYGLLRCVAGFFLGVVLAGIDADVFLKSRGPIKDSLAELALVALVFVAAAFSKNTISVQLVSIGNFALTILLFSGSTEGLVSKILTGKLARKLGDISYSIYLWHALVFVIIVDIFQFVFGRETTGNGGLIDPVAAYAAIFLALGVTLYLSAVSYKLIEKPARDCSKRVIARYAEKRMAKQPDFSPAE